MHARTDSPSQSGGDERQAAARSSEPAPEPALDALEFSVFARACPSRPVLEHLTGRWGLLVMAGLCQGSARFSALRRRVDGVSEKMLSQTLHALERDGFVRREVHAQIPPRVEYSLTPLGRTTAAKMSGLIDHLEAHMPDILAAQQQHDEARAESAEG